MLHPTIRCNLPQAVVDRLIVIGLLATFDSKHMRSVIFSDEFPHLGEMFVISDNGTVLQAFARPLAFHRIMLGYLRSVVWISIAESNTNEVDTDT